MREGDSGCGRLCKARESEDRLPRSQAWCRWSPGQGKHPEQPHLEAGAASIPAPGPVQSVLGCGCTSLRAELWTLPGFKKEQGELITAILTAPGYDAPQR